jgi:hypothetical protein
MLGGSEDPDTAGAVLDDGQDSVESGLSLLSVFALPRVDDRQMTISLARLKAAARRRQVHGNGWYVHSEVTGSRSIAWPLVIKSAPQLDST